MSNQRQNTDRREYGQQDNTQSKNQRLNNSNRNLTWRRDSVPNNPNTRDINGIYPIATVPTGFPIVNGQILGALPSYESGRFGYQLYNYGVGAFPPHGHIGSGPPPHGFVAHGTPSRVLRAGNPPYREFGGPHQACSSHGFGVHGRPSYGHKTRGIPPNKHGLGAQCHPFPGVFLSGLPKNCRDIEIIQFFDGLEVVDVFPVFKNRVFSGEAFVIFPSVAVFESARERDMQKIGEASVEVFSCKRQDYYHAVTAGVMDGEIIHDSMLKICGEPYFANKKMVIDFFDECNLNEDRVHILCDQDGQPTGEIHLELKSEEDVQKAMSRDKSTIGSHLVEIFPFTPEELQVVHTEPSQDRKSHDAPQRKKDRAGHKVSPATAVVSQAETAALKVENSPGQPEKSNKKELFTPVLRLWNVPPSCDMHDIIDFFGDFHLTLDRLQVVCQRNGVATGEVYVEFDSAEDAKKALSKNKIKILNNCVHICPSSTDKARLAMSS